VLAFLSFSQSYEAVTASWLWRNICR